MQLTKKQIEEFMDIWKKQFGERLTEGEAESEAKKLLDFMLILLKSSEDLPREAGK